MIPLVQEFLAKSTTLIRFLLKRYFLLGLVFCLALFVGVNAGQATPLLFQSATHGGNKEKDKPPSVSPFWVPSLGGGEKQFGAVMARFPSGFTYQGGAEVHGDILIEPLLVENQKLIPGTEFLIGIYAPNVQTDFQQPIQIQITLDAAQVLGKSGEQLVFKMYNPSTKRWEELSSEFNKDTFQISTFIQSFKPVPKEFPTWGDRTFLGVFERDLPPAPTPVVDPLGLSKVPISAVNAGQVVELARWGKGTARKLVAYSDSTGLWLAVATDEGVYIYDRSGKEIIQTGVFSTENPVDTIGIAPSNGLLAASAGKKVYVRLINDDTTNIIEAENRVTSLALSANATLIALGTENRVDLWKLEGKTWSQLDSLTGLAGWVRSLAFSPDGQRLVVNAEDGPTQIWTISDLKLIGTLGVAGVKSLAFSPLDSGVLATASNKQVQLWQFDDRKLLQTLKVHTDTVNSLTFSPDGALLASASDDQTIRLWSVERCTIQQVQCDLLPFTGQQNSPVENIVFLEDGQTSLSVSTQDQVQLWRVNDNEESETILSDHIGPISSLALSSDGQKLLLGSLDHTIHLWQMNDGRELEVLKAPASVKSVSFTPDGLAIMAGGNWTGIARWQLDNNKLSSRLGAIKGTVQSLAFSPDGTFLISSTEEGTVHLWEVNNEGLAYSRSLVDQQRVTSIALSSLDGTRLGVGMEDGTIQVLEATSGISLLPPLKGHTGVVRSLKFSPDGSIMASGGDDGIVRLWQVADGKILRILRGHTEPVTSLAFSPDGQILASGSTDDTAHLWMVEAGISLQTLKGHNGDVNSLIFSEDGLFLITGAGDGTVRLWGVSSQ